VETQAISVDDKGHAGGHSDSPSIRSIERTVA